MENSHFDKPELYSQNKSDILTIIILQRRDELINTMELYREKDFNSYETSRLLNKIRAKIESLYIEIAQPLKRKYKDDANYIEFLDNLKHLKELEAPELFNCFLFLNQSLDELNLIKIDVKQRYDTTNIEQENELKGL